MAEATPTPVQIKLNATLGFSGTSLEISIGTPVWLHWLRIAKAQTALARAAAAKAPAGRVTDEMYPAMIAITATAHALDGLYDQIRLLAPPRPKGGRPKRQRLILETLKQCFSIGKYWKGWLIEFDWLDQLRDPAVHPEHKTGPVVVHPSGWGNFAAEYVDYSAANAEKVLALLEDVLRTCVANPKPASREWAEGSGKTALNEFTA
jgi:hypothetical protein